jgi:hypothetical protein
VGLIGDLGPGPTAIDASIFIYLIEEVPRYLCLVVPLFQEADDGGRDSSRRRSVSSRCWSCRTAPAMFSWPGATSRC